MLDLRQISPTLVNLHADEILTIRRAGVPFEQISAHFDISIKLVKAVYEYMAARIHYLFDQRAWLAVFNYCVFVGTVKRAVKHFNIPTSWVREILRHEAQQHDMPLVSLEGSMTSSCEYRQSLVTTPTKTRWVHRISSSLTSYDPYFPAEGSFTYAGVTTTYKTDNALYRWYHGDGPQCCKDNRLEYGVYGPEKLCCERYLPTDIKVTCRGYGKTITAFCKYSRDYVKVVFNFYKKEYTDDELRDKYMYEGVYGEKRFKVKFVEGRRFYPSVVRMMRRWLKAKYVLIGPLQRLDRLVVNNCVQRKLW